MQRWQRDNATANELGLQNATHNPHFQRGHSVLALLPVAAAALTGCWEKRAIGQRHAQAACRPARGRSRTATASVVPNTTSPESCPPSSITSLP